MASPGQLVSVLAETLGLSRATVEWHDRNLVKAGLRSKSGRGSSAAKVTARDAAHLVVALLASDQTQQSVPSVTRYDKTVPHKDTSTKGYFQTIGIAELMSLPRDHSFVDAVEALIAAAVTGSLGAQSNANGQDDGPYSPIIELVALTPGTVGDVRISGLADGRTVHVRYAAPNPWISDTPPSAAEIARWEAKASQHPRGDFERLGRISGRTIWTIAQTLMAEPKDSSRE